MRERVSVAQILLLSALMLALTSAVVSTARFAAATFSAPMDDGDDDDDMPSLTTTSSGCDDSSSVWKSCRDVDLPSWEERTCLVTNACEGKGPGCTVKTVQAPCKNSIVCNGEQGCVFLPDLFKGDKQFLSGELSCFMIADHCFPGTDCKSSSITVTERPCGMMNCDGSQTYCRKVYRWQSSSSSKGNSSANSSWFSSSSPASQSAQSTHSASSTSSTSSARSNSVSSHNMRISSINFSTGSSQSRMENAEPQPKEETHASESSVSSTERRDNQPETTPVLGCYDPEGMWTTERNRCDPDQRRHTQAAEAPRTEPTSLPSPATEAEVRRMIEEKIVDQGERDSQRTQLLASIGEAIDRLTVLRERHVLPAEINTSLEGTSAWLAQVQQVFTEGSPSLEDIQIQAEALRVRLEETQTLVRAALEQNGMTQARKAEDLTNKFDRVLSAIPFIYALFQQNAVAMPQDATDAFNEASGLYNDIKPTCLENENECLRLSDVITALERAVLSVKQALSDAGKSDLEEQIGKVLKQ